MTALEEYTAHHHDSVEEIMHRWPWRRFEGMFRRHLLRKAREELRQMRDLRLAAIDSNTNFDMPENKAARQQRIEGLQESFEQAVMMLSSDAPMPQEDDADDDPLFSEAARRRLNQANQPLVTQAGMGRDLLEATS
jgi:hypothetical protein